MKPTLSEGVPSQESHNPLDVLNNLSYEPNGPRDTQEPQEPQDPPAPRNHFESKLLYPELSEKSYTPELAEVVYISMSKLDVLFKMNEGKGPISRWSESDTRVLNEVVSDLAIYTMTNPSLVLGMFTLLEGSRGLEEVVTIVEPSEKDAYPPAMSDHIQIGSRVHNKALEYLLGERFLYPEISRSPIVGSDPKRGARISEIVEDSALFKEIQATCARRREQGDILHMKAYMDLLDEAFAYRHSKSYQESHNDIPAQFIETLSRVMLETLGNETDVALILYEYITHALVTNDIDLIKYALHVASGVTPAMRLFDSAYKSYIDVSRNISSTSGTNTRKYWLFADISDAVDTLSVALDCSDINEVPRQYIESGGGGIVGKFVVPLHAQVAPPIENADIKGMGASESASFYAYVHPSSLRYHNLLHLLELNAFPDMRKLDILFLPGDNTWTYASPEAGIKTLDGDIYAGAQVAFNARLLPAILRILRYPTPVRFPDSFQHIPRSTYSEMTKSPEFKDPESPMPNAPTVDMFGDSLAYEHMPEYEAGVPLKPEHIRSVFDHFVPNRFLVKPLDNGSLAAEKGAFSRLMQQNIETKQSFIRDIRRPLPEKGLVVECSEPELKDRGFKEIHYTKSANGDILVSVRIENSLVNLVILGDGRYHVKYAHPETHNLSTVTDPPIRMNPLAGEWLEAVVLKHLSEWTTKEKFGSANVPDTIPDADKPDYEKAFFSRIAHARELSPGEKPNPMQLELAMQEQGWNLAETNKLRAEAGLRPFTYVRKAENVRSPEKYKDQPVRIKATEYSRV